ncbi:restriction endonuclease [Haladaptatus pallidirubidus]
MDNYDFEHFVAGLWERMEWSAQVSQQSNDAGIDVIAEKKTPYPQKAVIQAKRYSDSTTVGGPKIQQYASLKQQVPGADSTIVVTTSSFTNSAEERAKQLNVKTVDGQGLAAMVDELDARDLVSEYLDIPMEVHTDSEPSNREAAMAFEETSDHESGDHLSQTNRDEFGGTTANLSSESNQFSREYEYDERTESTNDQYSGGIELTNDSKIGEHDAEEAGNWHYGIIGISLILIGAIAGNASALSGFLLLLLPIVMYVDIRKVRNVSGWEPRAWLYVVFAFFLFFISVPVYIYFRNKSVGL